MSGGSYDYLYVVDAEALSARVDDLERMAARLREMGHLRPAQDTECVVALLKDAATLASPSLRKVWHAVEWKDSDDWLQEAVDRECAAYLEREERPTWQWMEDEAARLVRKADEGHQFGDTLRWQASELMESVERAKARHAKSKELRAWADTVKWNGPSAARGEPVGYNRGDE